MKATKRTFRLFSEELKRKIVKDIEEGKARVVDVCREYSVSQTSVYNWLDKYSGHLKTGRKLVLELRSEGYRSRELEKKVKELEAALGRKQLEVDFLNKMIELAGQRLGVNIKKKISTKHSIGLESSTNKKPSRR